MALGFVFAGMLLGLVSASLMLAFGAGFGAAVMAYTGFGSLGAGLVAVMAMLNHAAPRSKIAGLHAVSSGAGSP